MATVTKYFSGTEQLAHVYGEKKSRFFAIGGQASKHNAWDSFSRLVGYRADGMAVLPVTRKIEYKKYGSKHKCDSRCLNAKGHSCECSCGGLNHGAGSA